MKNCSSSPKDGHFDKNTIPTYNWSFLTNHLLCWIFFSVKETIIPSKTWNSSWRLLKNSSKSCLKKKKKRKKKQRAVSKLQHLETMGQTPLPFVIYDHKIYEVISKLGCLRANSLANIRDAFSRPQSALIFQGSFQGLKWSMNIPWVGDLKFNFK